MAPKIKWPPFLVVWPEPAAHVLRFVNAKIETLKNYWYKIAMLNRCYSRSGKSVTESCAALGLQCNTAKGRDKPCPYYGFVVVIENATS